MSARSAAGPPARSAPAPVPPTPGSPTPGSPISPVGAFVRACARAALGAAAACGGHYVTAPSPGTRNVVSATPSLRFSPDEISIAAGDSVTWAFGGIPHTVTFRHADDAAYGNGDGGAVPADIPRTTNASVTRVFTKGGSFGYECQVHPGMVGVVRVR